MQEEVTQKTIALVFKSSRLTADVLKKAMKMYLEHRKQGKQASHGKISVKELVGQGMGASSIEVTDNNIKSFERVARKYNVDFAVKKDKTVEPPKYMVFFKGKDADVITQAFKEFVKVNEKKHSRISVKEKLAQFREQLGKDKNRERAREHQKDRGQSLLLLLSWIVTNLLSYAVTNLSDKSACICQKNIFNRLIALFMRIPHGCQGRQRRLYSLDSHVEYAYTLAAIDKLESK